MKEILLLGTNPNGMKKELAEILARAATPVVLADCDLDNLYFHSMSDNGHFDYGEFVGTIKAEIDAEACLGCGMCEEQCRFEAIQPYISNTGQQKFKILDQNCTGCGVCQYICPESGIHDVDSEMGDWFTSEAPFGYLVHGALREGADNSGKFVGYLRKKAKEIALKKGLRHVICYGTDRPGCAELSAITATDCVLVVSGTAEASVENAIRIGKLTNYFRIPTGTIVVPNCQLDRSLNFDRMVGFDTFFFKGRVMPDTNSNGLERAVMSFWESVGKLGLE